MAFIGSIIFRNLKSYPFAVCRPFKFRNFVVVSALSKASFAFCAMFRFAGIDDNAKQIYQFLLQTIRKAKQL